MQFRDAGVGHIHVSSAMAYSAKEAADPALTPVPMEVPSELTPELPHDRASHVIERVDKLQQQFRDAGAVDPALTPEVADTPEAAGNDILCPNNHCRYKGTGKWMKAHGNKAGNGIVAMMVGGTIMLALLTTHPVAWLSLLVFFCIPVKYHKKIWKEFLSVASGNLRGVLLYVVIGAILLSFSAPSLFGNFFLSLSCLWIITWGFGNLKAGGTVRLCCPKCKTPVDAPGANQ